MEHYVSIFRDIGGHRSLEGQLIKRGVLFRSGELARISSEELEQLRHINLKLIIDLRTPQERKSKPDNLPQPDTIRQDVIRVVNVPLDRMGLEPAPRMLFKFLRGWPDGGEFEEFVRDYYEGLAFEDTAQVGEIFTLISDPHNLPALIHCTAGKDRTGLIAALIQLTVGVPRETVIQDFLTSNRYYEPVMQKYIRRIRRMTLFQVPPERIRRIFVVRREYLEHVLDRITETYGNVSGYLRKGCGIDPLVIMRLRQLLLE
jgi:protein-tyrosine phosphatase